MEQNFQTSFIPKKPIVEQKNKIRKGRGVGPFTAIAIFVFIIMVVVFAGVYFYKTTLNASLETKKDLLLKGDDRFKIDMVKKLETLDRRLEASSQILNKHIVANPIFKILQEITLKTIRFTSFGYSLDEKGEFYVKMQGVGSGYKTIAIQSDLFSENKKIIDPIFSNLALDERGNVTFDVEFYVDKDFVTYKNNLQIENEIPGLQIHNNPVPTLPGLSTQEDINEQENSDLQDNNNTPNTSNNLNSTSGLGNDGDMIIMDHVNEEIDI